MSNKLEILEEFKQAETKLNQLKSKEANTAASRTDDTIVIQPKFGDEMHELNAKCAQLSMVIEAMNASED
ncbi:hypothetical protein PL11_000645 [Lentilactobacillus curieae]|uniref:Uncharacterized protein n=1 Tax=Lentilactobacillus curieae TaxID=1138822 RepID=A0A1S6QG19_9LACO|nr:hypothetical protein [Lentilactobacillus curieae]AQW20548.1 hypothetical protein PL11_000645 [Lentilactobacillus curieae]